MGHVLQGRLAADWAGSHPGAEPSDGLWLGVQPLPAAAGLQRGAAGSGLQELMHVVVQVAGLLSHHGHLLLGKGLESLQAVSMDLTTAQTEISQEREGTVLLGRRFMRPAKAQGT